MGILTALRVRNAKPGRHADGLGLYLLVKPSGAKSWLLRVQVDGRRRDIGLGSVSWVTLGEAREKAANLRKVAKNGGDPIVARDGGKKSIPTFKKAAIACHAELSKGWEARHAAAWLSSLEEHAYARLGHMRVDSIEAAEICNTLTPIWTEVPVMARKVRQRIGTVLNFAKAKGWRATEAPSRSVTLGLPRQKRGGNFAAMPYVQVPNLVAQLKTREPSAGRRALLFTILTAARSGEVRAARWSHIDFERALWRRPAELMKTRVAHDVTLNGPALALLKSIADEKAIADDALIFPGARDGPLSDMTLTKALRDLGHGSTVHGFRSSFRDWAAEQMREIPDAVAEAALAHVVPNAVVRAYKRTTFLEMRRELLEAWAHYLGYQPSKRSAPRKAERARRLLYAA